jgi:gluconolactonase
VAIRRREFLKSAAAVGASTSSSREGRASPPGPQSKSQNRPDNSEYELGPDSKFHPGVPRGKVFDFTLESSEFFNGTKRTINVYVPAQYTARKPACVLIAFDGLEGFHVPAVLDNLIHNQEMPVTFGIGLLSGVTPSIRPAQNPRFNRSFEFDSMTSVMPEFILHELLPEVEKQKTPDNRPIRLSDDANDRAVAGCSSGGIAAFNVAWRRADAFRRVYFASGTFVGMRGGDRYPVLIRKTEPKPLRVFINDGDRDEWWGGPEFGDWWVSNQDVERALTFAGYDVRHVWGHGAHCQQAAAVFPDAMRWLWRDWPKPVTTRQTGNFKLTEIIKPGEGWRVVAAASSTASQVARASRPSTHGTPVVVAAHSAAGAMASDAQGRVCVQNTSDGSIHRIGRDDDVEPFARVSPGDNGLAFGPDGRLYVADTDETRILTIDSGGNISVIAQGLRAHRLTVTHNGNIYATEATGGGSPGRIWLVRPNGTISVVAEGLDRLSGSQ